MPIWRNEIKQLVDGCLIPANTPIGQISSTLLDHVGSQILQQRRAAIPNLLIDIELLAQICMVWRVN